MWEKEKMFVISIFHFSHDLFYPVGDKNQCKSHIHVVVCKYFQFGPFENFIIW